MDQKMATANQRTAANKHQPNNKTKKRGPLRVVHITNPIKFTATASEFRALVQELTGQDSDPPETSRLASGGVAAVEADCGVHHAVEGGMKTGQSGRDVGQNGSDPFRFGSYDDDEDGYGLCNQQVMDGFQGLMGSGFWHEGDGDHHHQLKSM